MTTEFFDKENEKIEYHLEKSRVCSIISYICAAIFWIFWLLNIIFNKSFFLATYMLALAGQIFFVARQWHHLTKSKKIISTLEKTIDEMENNK